MPKAEARKHFEAFAGAVTETLRGDEEVRISGFGKFEVRERAAQEGVNPWTKKKMQIRAAWYCPSAQATLLKSRSAKSMFGR